MNDGKLFLVYSKTYWISEPIFKWSEKEIDNADDKGLIGTKFGIDCYLSKDII